MCGRARCTLSADGIPRACHRTGAPARSINMDMYRPYYNVSPGSNLPVVYRVDDGSDGQGYALHCMTWGLVPGFTKKTEKPDFYRMFNARSESVGEKASFRRLLPKNRCLVAVEGFYEWKKDGSKKQPYYIHLKDGRALVFAALYDSWQNSEGDTLYTFTILTTSSSSALQWLHDRMPVILGDKGSVDTWLNGSPSFKFDTVLKPYENSDLVWYPVTPAIGKTSFNSPECIKEIQLKTEDKGTISRFFSRKETKESKCEKSAEMEFPKSVKEEAASVDKSEIQSLAETLDHDSKPIVSATTSEEGTKWKTKREHEESLEDTRQSMDKVDKLLQTPPSKKANLRSGGDKQPTLLSFFNKK